MSETATKSERLWLRAFFAVTHVAPYELFVILTHRWWIGWANLIFSALYAGAFLDLWMRKDDA